MSEIVPAEPIGGIYFEPGETSTASASASASEAPRVTLAITNGSNTVEYVPEPFDSERLPTVFASEIQRFLRVANLLGKEEPRVAYLCESFLLSGSLSFFHMLVDCWEIQFLRKLVYNLEDPLQLSF